MVNIRALYILAILCVFSSQTLKSAEKPHEELMVVQTVSSDRRSFIVTKGLKDGLIKGQEVIYANENVSILCKALEVNRSYSLWVPVDRNINIPFNKDEFVSYNSHNYGNVALDVIGDINNLIPAVNYDIEYKKFRSSNNYSLKASYDRGITQSTSDVSTGQNSNPTGFSYALEYNYRFIPEFEMSAGARIDNQVYRISDPELDIPTSRIMATFAITYHLMSFSKDKNNYYLSLGAGMGKSTTTIDEQESTGTVTLLPEVRAGFIMPFSRSVAMVFEASIESLSTHETLADETDQASNIVNTKFTIGLRF